MTRNQFDEQLAKYTAIVKAEAGRLFDVGVEPPQCVTLAQAIANARMLVEARNQAALGLTVRPPFMKPGDRQ